MAVVKPKLVLSLGLLGSSQADTEQEDVLNASNAEMSRGRSGSECRSGQEEVGRSPSPGTTIMLTQHKLARLHAEKDTKALIYASPR